MKIISFVLLFVLGFQLVQAQERSVISGRVMAGQKPLPGATVTITRLTGNAKLSSHVTTSDGRFTIPSLPQKDSLKIAISFIGYLPFEGLLFLKEKRFAMAAITLEPQSGLMDTVVVKTEKLVTVKGDTIEFNASAIKTPPNSMASDLLKRIPGLELTRDGRLSYNGRPVTRILVDGKTFFSDDGGIVLNNIPADMIDKIQLVNEIPKSEFGREETDGAQVLNFKLKPGKKYFANGLASAGTDARYDASLFGSCIFEKNRFGLALGKNNINKAAGNTNNSVELITNGSGVIKTTSGSLEYGTIYKGGQTINASYNFNLPATFKEAILQRRQDILGATTLITNAHQSAVNNGGTHRAGLVYQSRKAKRVIFASANNSYTNIDNHSTNNTVTTDAQANLLNTLSGNYQSRGTNIAVNAFMNAAHFIAKGKSLEWNLALVHNNNNTSDRNDATTFFYKNNILDSQFHFRQQIENENRMDNLNFNFKYNQSLGKHALLVLSNSFNKRFGKTNRTTWSLDSFDKRIDIDTMYSNALTNNAVSNISELALSYNKNNWFTTAGASLIENLMTQKDAMKKNAIRQATVSPAIRTSISYGNKKMRWTLGTVANYALPALEQLQPVADLTNPLYIVEGNPALKPQISYSNTFNWKNKKPQVNGRPAAIVNSVDLNWNLVHDKIINAVYYDTLGRQRLTFMNVNGTYSLGARTQFSFQRKWKAHMFTIGLRPGLAYQKDKTFINGSPYATARTSVRSSLNFSYRKSDIIALLIDYAPSFNDLRYQQNRHMNQSYALHTLKLDLDLYLLRKIKMSHSIDYSFNNNLPAIYHRSSLLWNASASLVCLKNKKGEISFNAFDILHRFNNLVRTIGSNYIEDTQANNLQRYCLFGFKYFFGKLTNN